MNKSARLKSRKLIEELFNDGKSFSYAPFKVFYLHTQTDVFLQAGFGVSAKSFKRATDRNRIKRLTREAYRLQKKDLDEKLKVNHWHLAVFFIYIGKEIPEYPLIFKKMGSILKKLIQIADENNTSNN
ncbi:MAG TPA: ribonuclease P protein component [Puia sp.]|nr:ribonuclease P protein component [Puia sp.]